MILGRAKAIEILEYCRPHIKQMWAATIVGIILGCDFKDSESALKAFFREV